MRQRRYEMQKCNNNKNILIWDNETGECLGFTAQIKGRLNLQDDINKAISYLQLLKKIMSV